MAENPRACSDRLHPQHGGELVDPAGRAGRRMVCHRTARTWTAHYGPDYYCHGTGSDGGLKEEGPDLLHRWNASA